MILRQSGTYYFTFLEAVFLGKVSLVEARTRSTITSKKRRQKQLWKNFAKAIQLNSRSSWSIAEH
jgi:hypothetical protein